MQNTTKIGQILTKINWEQIQDYHKKLNILWDIKNKNGTKDQRVPSELEIKEEVKSLLLYMFDNTLDYISYGNWVILWEGEDEDISGEVRVIFKLIDYLFTERLESHKPFDKESVSSLKLNLKCAVKDEDYEYAAILRDEIQKLDKKDYHNK